MHGRPRNKKVETQDEVSADAKKAGLYKKLLVQVIKNHKDHLYDKDAMAFSAQLLERNPEVGTAWNYRKLALTHLINEAITQEESTTQRTQLVEGELRLVEKALGKNPKSYGAWYHRKWLMRLGLSSLERELQLVEKLLDLDSRNFHGWNYRRFVVQLMGRTAADELSYSTKKINQNFSNYSAWHYRSTLLADLHGQRGEEESCPAWLEEEYDLVKQALWTEPEDQSGWIYHTWLRTRTSMPPGPHLFGAYPPPGSTATTLKSSPHTPLVAVFSEAVHGVSGETLKVLCGPAEEEVALSWRALGGSRGSARAWAAELDGGSVLKEAAKVLVRVVVGSGDGILSSLYGLSLLKFEEDWCFELVRDGETSVSGAGDSGDLWAGPPKWLEEAQAGGERERGEIDNSGVGWGRGGGGERGWRGEVLAKEVEMLEGGGKDGEEGLLEMEPNSKWAMLTLSRLLLASEGARGSANSTDASSVSGSDPARNSSEKCLELFLRLEGVDSMRNDYYLQMAGDLRLDQMTRKKRISVTLSENLHSEEPGVAATSYHVSHWMTLRHLSLLQVPHVHRLLNVSRLDLSHNKLHSCEGLEALQLLSFLNLSHNHIAHTLALAPLHYLPLLQALNLSHNCIGSSKPDTSRYALPHPKQRTVSQAPGRSDASFCTGGNTFDKQKLERDSLEVALQGLEGLPLVAFEFCGNKLLEVEGCKDAIKSCLPLLKWLDGEDIKESIMSR